MMGWTIAWGIGAASCGTAILIVSGPLSIELRFARELFALCLVIEAVVSVRWFRRGQRGLAILVAATAVTLLVLSMLPIYVQHSTPWEHASHRHTIWELGHVH